MKWTLSYALALIITNSNFAHAEPADKHIPVKFGATLSLLGPSAPMAQACQRGIELAVEDVNASGGVAGQKLEVLIDSFQETDLSRAVSAGQKFLNVDKVVALLPNWSEDAEVLAPIAQAHGVVSMALGAAGPRAARFSPLSFRASTSDSELARASVRFERQQGAKSLCILTANTGYYVDVSDEIVSAWRASGGSVVYQDTIVYGNSAVSTEVTKVRAAGCDSVFVWASPVTLAAVSAELRKQKIRARRVYPWFADTKEVLDLTKGDDNAYTLHKWAFNDASFMQRYSQKFNADFMRPAGNCYDGVRVLASVMSQVGTQADKVRDALLGLKNYVGITGPFIIGSDRERSGEASQMFAIKEGELVKISTE